jgi:DNA-binding GntR family transcriptional regulator
MLGHEAVVAALRRRDADAAAAAMRAHIDQIADLFSPASAEATAGRPGSADAAAGRPATSHG